MDPYYADESVTLYLGDCLDEVDGWLAGDVLVTDPPYGMNRDLSRSSLGVYVAGDHSTDARTGALTLWGESPAIVFGHWRRPRPQGVRYLAIWDKVHMALGDSKAAFATTHEEIYFIGEGWNPGRRPTVLRYSNLLGGRRPDHPTPKPVGLMEQLLKVAPPGVIADPFAGSGSTLLAARNLGRKAIGVEIEERYCELTARRLAQGVLM